MFHQPPRPSTLNAIQPSTSDTTRADHRAANLATCLELRDLGMCLARAAASRALEAHENPPPPPEPNTATPTPPCPDLAFARHSRSVRQSIELWEKITSNAFARHATSASSAHSSAEPISYPDDEEDDRPAYNPLDGWNLYEAVGNLSESHPDRTEIIAVLKDTIEETLTAHPDDHLSANFARVCARFGIEPDRFQLAPHLESQLRPPREYPKLE